MLLATNGGALSDSDSSSADDREVSLQIQRQHVGKAVANETQHRAPTIGFRPEQNDACEFLRRVVWQAGDSCVEGQQHLPFGMRCCQDDWVGGSHQAFIENRMCIMAECIEIAGEIRWGFSSILNFT